MGTDPSGRQAGTDPDRKRLIRLVIGGIIIALVIAFAAANSQRVEIDYLVGSSDWRLIWVILGSAVLGSLVTLLGQRRRRSSK